MKSLLLRPHAALLLLLPLLPLLPSASAAPWPEAPLAPFADVPSAVTVPLARPLEEAPTELATARAAKGFFEEMDFALTDAQRAALERDKFVLIPIETLPWLDPMEREPYVPETPEEAKYFPAPTGGLGVYEDEMLSIYGRIGAGGDLQPWRNHFVTADSMLHAWHRFFENALEEVEAKELHPRLDAFLSRWLGVLRARREGDAPELAAHWAQLEAQVALALVLLGDDGEEPRKELTAGWNEDGSPKELVLEGIRDRAATVLGALPQRWRQAALDELRLVLAKEGLAPSPLFGGYDPDQTQDYTQYTPRSHYAKNQALRAYFRSMMYLGRNGWPLQPPDQGGESIGLSHALLLAESLASPAPDGEAPLEGWRRIMEISAFFAGGSDDVDYPELRRWLAGQTDLGAWSSASAFDPGTLASLGVTLGELRQPGILSQARRRAIPGEVGEEVREASLQFRVFGQRFTYDAWVLTELTPPMMTTLPATPTALYVAAAFGDPAAREFALAWLDERGVADRAGYESKLAKLAATLAGVPDEEWFSSMAAKKLHLIGTLAGPKTEGFPGFMRSPRWGAKHVETMLGAYTQLKHDTLLYAKQSYAEMGEGALDDRIDESEVPYGFVQPEVRFWAELERLVHYTYEGFSRHGLLPNVVEDFGHLGRFRKDVAALRLLANKTAAGERWNLEDRLWLLEFNPAYMAEPVDPMNVPGPDDGKAAIVADIQTNVQDSQVLYQALGRPHLVLALVGTDGVNRLVAGTAYDYYEFTQPLQERLTDEEWRKRFYRLDPEAPSKPSWTVPAAR
jgi:hypothetical protein